MSIFHRLRGFILFALLLALCACQSVNQGPQMLPIDTLKVGVAPFTQPVMSTQLMAGYIPQPQGMASAEDLSALDATLAAQIATGQLVVNQVPQAALQRAWDDSGDQPLSALARWISLAKAQNLDLLIVPQVLSWRQRDGGNYGVVSPAALDMDIFLVDARGEGRLLQRAHFSEEQKALTQDLFKIGLFLERGGRWVTTQEMAQAAIKSALQEFGL